MRIISGTYKGRAIVPPRNLRARPTTDFAKENLFNVLGNLLDFEECDVLDLFAGTGQMGIECLSRGAAAAVFVDRRKDAFALIKKNLALTGLQDRARVVHGDSLAFLAGAGESFDLVFLDPPYASGLLEQALERLAAPGFDILAPYGIIVAEHPADRVPPSPAHCRLQRTYRYGKIAVTIFRREGTDGNNEGSAHENSHLLRQL